MPSFIRSSLFLVAVLLLGGVGSPLVCAREQTALSIVVVAAEGGGFVEKDSGQTYIPFGTNYYDPHTGWAPRLWMQFDAEKVRRHFEIMRKLGVNCARVFLTAASFQPQAGRVEQEALNKLDTLVKTAGETGIRLILTGPDHWEGAASYWRPDRFAGEQALRALEHFWDVVGHRYQNEGAIFAWDLLNEPHLPWFEQEWRGQWNTWLQKRYVNSDALKSSWGEELGDEDQWGSVAVPKDEAARDNPRLRDWQLFREYLADEWVRRQVEAIRRADPSHLITVGYIQWSYPLVRPGRPSRYAAFNPHRQAQWLDFVTIHFYPTLGDPFGSKENWQTNLNYLQAVLAYCHAGKPVILGEYGWYGGGAAQNSPLRSEDDQALWLSAEIEASRGLTDGWLSWPFADTPSSRDISIYAGLVKSDMTVKAWGRKFKVFASNLSRLKKPMAKPAEFDFSGSPAMGDEELRLMHNKYVNVVRKAETDGGL